MAASLHGRVHTAASRPKHCAFGVKPGSVLGTRRIVSAHAAAAAVNPSEAEALAVFSGAHPGCSLETCLAVLEDAASSKRVAPQVVEGGLAFLEQALPSAVPVPSIDGTWRLVFSTATSLRTLQYIPVDEDLVLHLETQQLALRSSVGPVSFDIKGRIDSWDAASAALDFRFEEVDVLLLGNKVWTKQINSSKPKTYTWFYVGDKIAAARSSAGGLSLLRK